MSRTRKPPILQTAPIMRQFHNVVEASGLTFARLQEASGVHAQTIQNWGGKVNPGVLNMEAVLNAIGHELVIRKCE